MSDSLKQHLFNASYLAIFLYGTRRIMRKIRPISFDDAYSYLHMLTKKAGSHIFLVHKDGTYYHVANAPDRCLHEVTGAIASHMGALRCWTKVTAEQVSATRIVWNVPITTLLPPEAHCRIPKFAQAMKHAYGEGV